MALAVSPQWSAAAQGSDPAPTPAAPAPVRSEPAGQREAIIVIGNRSVVASLADLAVEQTYNEDDVATYAANSVGEIIDAIRDENDDENPTILVNGRPVADTSDISDLPPEAIARIETLPRGAAQRVNGAAGQRAYNVVLKGSVRTAIATVSQEIATDGDWSNRRGEIQLTRVKGQNRLNFSLRGADSGYLLESERPYVPRADDLYYSSIGNVLPAFGATEVSPPLSALVGRPVTSVALPAGVALPTLAVLGAGANALNPTQRGDFRSLRGASRPINVSLSGNRELGDVFSLSFNAQAGWNENRSLSGLARSRITIPGTNAFSPFGNPVGLYLEDVARPLHSTSRSNNQGLSATLNALVGKWRGSLNARFDRRAFNSIYEFSGSLPALANTTNPFDGSLSAQIPIGSNRYGSVTRTATVSTEASGPLLNLWAGPVSARVSGAYTSDSYRGRSSTSADQALRQHQFAIGGGLSLPLTGSDPDFLPALGTSDLAFDIGRVDLGSLGSLQRHSLALNWQALPWLRLVARSARSETAIAPPLLAAPATTVQDVPYFDPVTGETVEVTTIYGGFAGLLPEDRRTKSIALTATPWKQYNFQFDAEYLIDDARNQIGALPDPTPAVLAAFPDRFVRDATGTLVLVDQRSINLARQRDERLRIGVRYTLPLSSAPRRVPAADGRPAYRTAQTKLQITVSHTELLSSTSVIRTGLPVLDLLDGSGIGFGGAQPRGSTSANFTLSCGLSGVRLDFRRRGESYLLYGTSTNPQLLTFGALTTLDAKAYADLGELFGTSRWAKGARVTIALDNAFNRRQNVVDRSGFVPQAFQPIRRDPLGRTVLFELRKAF